MTSSTSGGGRTSMTSSTSCGGRTSMVSIPDIRYLKGVGPKRVGLLNRLGINTVEDLLYYLPRRYEDRSNFTLVRDLKIGEYQAVKGKILTQGAHITKRRINVFQIALADKTGIIYCVWFNQPFLKKFFKTGQELMVYGKVEKYVKLQINHPEYEFVKTGTGSLNIGKIVPIYSLTQDVSQQYLRFLAREAIERFLFSANERLPAYIRARRHLADIRFAIRNIHFPVSFENLDKAYKRIVFEEFFILQLALALKKKKVKTGAPGIRHKLDAGLIDSFKKLFPFELTQSQLKAINEIQIDMASPKPMNRLLEGDVGSGKTIVAIYALLLTAQNGYQASIMAPTEILAKQHYVNISELLMPLGVNIRLLVSGLKPAKRLEIENEIKSGETDVVIGTHALIWQGVKFKKLGLVVVDEQHKFGVTQRHVLRKKGLNPDVLVMTATPIPRTLALTIYGDLDISVIKELPKGRYPISTYCASEDKRESVYNFIREEVKKGRQAYIVYPKIWSGKKAGSTYEVEPVSSGLKAAAAMYNKLQTEVFPDLRLGLIHGRMLVKEKNDIMKKFKDKKIDILLSTTVIEVGIDVANASCMLIENAERFGLSQLHQLRGRIGRGAYPSYCILLGNPKTETAKKRFYTMSETQDGFEVAEQDLELRGPGEFFGTRQHGLPELRFGNILRDFEIMEQARAEAFQMVREDPYLRDPRNIFIRDTLKKRFAGKLELISVG
ncbi:MAG: ATP-dependent DNA helicase RecG [Candidatus Omnitrophota bacterium]|nr:MAG: ATP-dependent DNA helicase RecG [Candidatus Omnitrophota bacterium]